MHGPFCSRVRQNARPRVGRTTFPLTLSGEPDTISVGRSLTGLLNRRLPHFLFVKGGKKNETRTGGVPLGGLSGRPAAAVREGGRATRPRAREVSAPSRLLQNAGRTRLP